MLLRFNTDTDHTGATLVSGLKHLSVTAAQLEWERGGVVVTLVYIRCCRRHVVVIIEVLTTQCSKSIKEYSHYMQEYSV